MIGEYEGLVCMMRCDSYKDSLGDYSFDRILIFCA